MLNLDKKSSFLFQPLPSSYHFQRQQLLFCKRASYGTRRYAATWTACPAKACFVLLRSAPPRPPVLRRVRASWLAQKEEK